MTHTVLIVEDEERIRSLLRTYFEEHGHKVLTAADGRQATTTFDNNKVDLVILDILMPHLNGWEVIKRIRAKSDVPIIFLTALNDEDDKLNGYELGADDYVTKPFSPKVLVAKAETLLKRTHGQRLCDLPIVLGAMTIDEKSRIIKIADEVVELTAKEYDLLLYLIQNPSTVLTRDMFLNRLWGYDYYGDSRIIDAHIKKIRKKIGVCANYIQTVTGVGYKFEVKDK